MTLLRPGAPLLPGPGNGHIHHSGGCPGLAWPARLGSQDGLVRLARAAVVDMDSFLAAPAGKYPYPPLPAWFGFHGSDQLARLGLAWHGSVRPGVVDMDIFWARRGGTNTDPPPRRNPFRRSLIREQFDEVAPSGKHDFRLRKGFLL